MSEIRLTLTRLHEDRGSEAVFGSLEVPGLGVYTSLERMWNRNIPSQMLGVSQTPGSEKTWSTQGATLSETQAFLMKPARKTVKDARTRTSDHSFFSVSCGRNWTARTIGPATSCGKNPTNIARSSGVSTGSSRLK